MADIDDITARLAAIIADVLYPNGTSQPSICGIGVAVSPGWPLPAQLDADIKANRARVTVYARGDGRNTTRYPVVWQETQAAAQTLTLSHTDTTVTLGGTVSTPQVVVVNGQAYAVQPTDTLDSIAAGVAALIPGASSAGPVVSCPTGIKQAALAATGTVSKETRRQTETLQVTVWAESPQARGLVAKAVDTALSELSRFDVDGASVRLFWRSAINIDRSENALIYRRDILYSIEYPTVVSQVATQIATPIVNTTVGLQ